MRTQEEKNKYSREYYHKNREILLAKSKSSALKNKARKAAYEKKRYDENKKHFLEKNLRKLYGSNAVDIYNKLHKEQNGCCAICKINENEILNSRGRKLYVDHCHDTGKIRGLLCHLCNFSIGGFRDNVVYLQSAIDYLNKNE